MKEILLLCTFLCNVFQRLMKNDFSFLCFCLCVCVSACDMLNAFDRIVESGREKWKRFFIALYYTSDKLQFFVTCARARCHFSDAHFIIYCNLYAGENMHFFLAFLIPSSIFSSIHLFPEWCKKTSLYSEMLTMQFFLCCSTVVFLHFRQTHIHMCINIANIRLHIFYFTLLCIFALDANFLSRVLFDSLMVKWLYGLVWSVILIFYVCYSLLLADVAGMRCRAERGEVNAFCLCADFCSMMMVLWAEGKEVNLARRIIKMNCQKCYRV
jgi:hypothetical protein